MHERHRRRCAAALLCLVASAAAPGQQPDHPAPTPVPAERPRDGQPVEAALGKAQQALIDEFLHVMPRDPVELRDAGVRARITEQCLPILHRVQAFAAANARSLLAERVAEFRIYALVLGDAELRKALTANQTRGDRDAVLQLATADVILAASPAARAQALATVATVLGKPATAEAAAPQVADCAVNCLAIAAALDDDELDALAKRTVDTRHAKRFAELAEGRRRDLSRQVGRPFTIDGRTHDGATLTTATQRGKVVVVDFWATWCGPCVRALPELVQLRQSIGGGRLAVVGVSCDRDPAALRKFLAEHPELDWPQLFEPDQEAWHPLATRLGITAIPRLLVIDRAGRLYHADAGKNLEAIVRECLER